MRVLVTGGSGMLGRVLLKAYSNGAEVIGVSRSGSDKTRVCDLSDEEQINKLFLSEPFDLVIHTAAYSDVDGCERDPKLAHACNALSTKYLAKACGQKNTPFIYVSTDYVFDGNKSMPYAETDVTCPVNIYGMTKLEGEYHTRSYASVSATVRTSWLFGAGNPNNFVNAITDRLNKESEVRVLADQVDSPTYVNDLAAALRKISDRLILSVKMDPQKRVHDTFQVCNAGKTTRFEMAKMIKELLKLKNVRVERLDKMSDENRPARRPLSPVMSTRRFETMFETKLRAWEDSLKEYIKGTG